MANKAKIQFTARKDPLLRDRDRVSPGPKRIPLDPDPAAATAVHVAERAPGGVEPTLDPPAVDGRDAGHAREEPRGVIAVSGPVPDAPATGRASGPVSVAGARDSGVRARSVDGGVSMVVSGRRVQTSMSLPSELWSELERFADGAGSTAGELLNAVLRRGLPDSPEAALAVVERALERMPLDEGFLEERNYRLLLEVRSGLDRLSRMLAVGSRARAQRSLLIRGILIDHPLATPEEARELINGLRVQAMRESLRVANRVESVAR